MQRGIKSPAPRPGKLAASTFVELVITMVLLVLFASLAFPILWGTTKATTAHTLENASQEAALTLATTLPRFTEQVTPPYWENPATVFTSSGSELKAFYRNGIAADYLLLRKDSDTRLSLVTPEATLRIDNLPDLSLEWWKKDDRILGISIRWRYHNEPREFHAAWGAFLL